MAGSEKVAKQSPIVFRILEQTGVLAIEPIAAIGSNDLVGKSDQEEKPRTKTATRGAIA